MIIKKKYTNVKPQNKEPQKEESIEIIEQDFQKEVLKEDEQKEQKENVTPSDVANEKEETEEEPQKEKKEKKKRNANLDLSLENITFEQREERREGTRRRGYRRTQDRNIVSRAQKDAESIKESAKQEGYKEGVAQAQKDLEDLRLKFSEFYNYKEEVFLKVSECIMDISIEIAKKIINKEIETDRKSTITMIKGVVEEINKTENKITLRVMPQDVELVRDMVPEIFSGNYFEAKITVIPDEKIKQGGVVVETSNGLIDATIDTQLAIIAKALNGKEEN